MKRTEILKVNHHSKNGIITKTMQTILVSKNQIIVKIP